MQAGKEWGYDMLQEIQVGNAHQSNGVIHSHHSHLKLLLLKSAGCNFTVMIVTLHTFRQPLKVVVENAPN